MHRLPEPSHGVVVVAVVVGDVNLTTLRALSLCPFVPVNLPQGFVDLMDHHGQAVKAGKRHDGVIP